MIADLRQQVQLYDVALAELHNGRSGDRETLNSVVEQAVSMRQQLIAALSGTQATLDERTRMYEDKYTQVTTERDSAVATVASLSHELERANQALRDRSEEYRQAVAGANRSVEMGHQLRHLQDHIAAKAKEMKDNAEKTREDKQVIQWLQEELSLIHI